MPNYSFGYYDVSRGRRSTAWAAHYEAKGCSAWKARELAWKKTTRKNTWPPGAQP